MDNSTVTTNTVNDFPGQSDLEAVNIQPYLKITTAPIVASNFTVDSTQLVAITSNLKVPVIIESWPVQQREPSSSHLVTGKEIIPSSQLTAIAI